MLAKTHTAVVNFPRSYIESILFIAIWVAIGLLLGLDAESYLALGVPLVLIFQLFVRRRPLRELWVRDPEQQLRVDALGAALSLGLLIVPIYLLVTVALPLRHTPIILFLLCIMAGGAVGGFVLRNQRADALRHGLPSFGAALLIGFGILVIEPLLAGRSLMVPLDKVPSMLQEFLMYVAASFALEEVVFRGMLDPHVYPAGEVSGRARAWGTALFVSVLWALWHLPLGGLGTANLTELIAILLFVHILAGIPLSFCWRQGGTLVLPAIAHALIDAYRNVLMP